MTWIVLAGVLASPLLAFLPPANAPRIVDTGSVLPPKPFSPGGGIHLSGTTIRWRPVVAASLYNVILVRGSERVDLWSNGPSVRVTRPESREDTSRPKVRYSWFVYPGFELAGRTVQYGALIAEGTIAVEPGALRSDVRLLRP